MKLHTQISIALVAGALAGLASNYFGIGWLQSTLVAIEPIGTAWIDLITMVVIPLVVASLVVGTASLGDMTKLGRLGGKTVAFYLVTTAVAVTIGLVLSNVIVPGGRIDPATLESLRNAYMDESAQQVQTAQAQDTGIVDMLLGMIPRNPVAALTEMRMLPIIIFSIFLGAAVSVLPEDTGGSTVISFFDGINEASMKMVHWIMKLAPYAVFALIAAVVAQFGLEVLQSLLVYCAVVIGGLVLHLLITYTSALKFLAKVDLSEWFKRIREVPLIAFSTSSSNATLPVTMETAEEELGVSRESSSFVLPLGATINMDGTALYQAVATMFIAQVLVGQLALTAQIGIVLTATLASIGAAGVPSAGIIILVIVLTQALPAGVDPAAGIALIFGVDRILDMCRTALNVTGDLTAVSVIAVSENETLTVDAPRKPSEARSAA